ncbi:MAG: hypothetical protein U0R68_14440 [Candidatus Nanopelagicales bacterium]
MSAHAAPGSPRRPLRTVLLLLAALLPVVGLLVVSPTATAHHGTDKVTFCHATSSSTNPYVSITTDPASIIKVGHDHHTGPLWSPTLGAHVSWGDVIPSFTWVDKAGTVHRYSGLNTDHLDVIANGCVVPPISVTVTAPVSADQTCTASGTVALAAVTGVVWKLDGRITAAGSHAVTPGTHSVVATAMPGYAITGTSTWSITIARATGCDIVVVTPVAPTVEPSTRCGVEGTYTIPATTGVLYLLDGEPIASGTYDGPVDGLLTVQALPGYRLSDPYWSVELVVAAAEACPTVVQPVAPTSDPSPRCGVQGTYTIPSTTGITYLLDGETIAAGTYRGPVDGVVTAEAQTGYTLADPQWSVHLVVVAAEACPVIVVVTPVEPTVAQSTACGVEGTYTIPSTRGVQYLLDGEPIAAGTYDGPASGTVTATALEGYRLSTKAWSFELSLPAADTCTLPSTGGSTLAETGSSTGPLAGAAALLLALGTGLVVATARRPVTVR